MSVRRAARRLATAVPASTTWAVTASANLALRGYDVEPDDLDVKTDATGVRGIVQSFPDAVVRPVSPPGTTDADWIRSHFAVLDLEGVTVELVGDADVWDPEAERWVPSPPVEGNREWLDVDGVPVPAMMPDDERRQYRARGDEARLARLEPDA